MTTENQSIKKEIETKIESEDDDLDEVEEMVESRYVSIPQNAKVTMYSFAWL